MADPLMLARVQFAANITFHILFPTITIAMGWFLLFFKIQYNRTRLPKWQDAYGFWVKVFALCFALGIVSGVTMSFQFGTNWPGFMQKAGNIAGPLLAYEVLSAFFLEATFLGVMLFGASRVSAKMHTIATALVAGGTTLSAFWIIVLDSWMQTPVGHTIDAAGKMHVADWLAVLFNPSMPYRLGHMLTASGLTAAFLIAGVSAYRLLRNDKSEGVMAALRTGVFAAAALIPLQILIGDMHGLNTLAHQPAKIAAMEGIWQTEKGAPLTLFAIPDKETKSNQYAVTIPGAASLILTHDLQGEIKGIDTFGDQHPPVAPVFYAFRVMAGVGVLMMLISWFASWRLWRTGEPGHLAARGLMVMTFSGWIATVAGWYVTEIGRQPYLIQGILTTAEAASKTVTSGMIGASLTMYLILYAGLLVSFISALFYMARKAGEKGSPPSGRLPTSSAPAHSV